MKEIFLYLKNYIKNGNKKAFLYTSLMVASLVALNYTFGIERTLKTYDSPFLRVLGFFLLYAFVFAMAHGIQFLVSGKTVNDKNQFYFLLLLAAIGKIASRPTYLTKANKTKPRKKDSIVRKSEP